MISITNTLFGPVLPTLSRKVWIGCMEVFTRSSGRCQTGGAASNELLATTIGE